MRVLLIDVNCKTSSTGQIVYDLYSFLNSQGEQAAVCFGRGDKIEEENIFKFGIDWETYLHAFLTRLTGYTGCFSYFSTKRLIRFIEDFKPDIVHIHELHAYFVNIKPLLNYLIKNNINVVHTLHCEFSYTGKCGHSVECEKWITECHNCPHLHDYVSTLLFDHTRRMFNVKKEMFTSFNNLILTAPSKWLYDRIGKSFLCEYPRYVVHNGVDTDIFKPVDTSMLRKKYSIIESDVIILALAPNLMSKEKGGYDIRIIANKLKDTNIKFILVGVDGVVDHVEENMIICGRIYDKKLLAQYYSIADAFVICSERENYPTTCLEAQACGTPIYGYMTGGTLETYLQDELHFVEYGDINGLVELLSNITHKSQDSVSSLRKLAIDKLSKKQSMKNYYKIYKECGIDNLHPI